MNDGPSTLPASPTPIRLATFVSWLLVAASLALALYAYFRLSYPKTVLHHGPHGVTSEDIESYIFGPACIQVLAAIVLAYKALLWYADQPRIAEYERRRRAANPQARSENLNFYYRLFCVGIVFFQLFLFSVTAYHTFMIAEKSL